jgi:hypothetical protein
VSKLEDLSFSAVVPVDCVVLLALLFEGYLSKRLPVTSAKSQRIHRSEEATTMAHASPVRVS